jgi:chloramphenicol-sensitive protein RarD
VRAQELNWQLEGLDDLNTENPQVRAALRDKGTLLRVFISALLISVNWGLYIHAVTSGQVLEASLGYYINPLVTVLLGFVVLRERPSRLQWFAIVLAALGVAYSLVIGGHMPWLALGMAVTFAFYACIRKTVRVESAPGLLLETCLLTPFALAWMVWMHTQGMLFFNPAEQTQASLLLIGGGVVTAAPLLLFAYAVRHISLITLGLLQYISPTITLLLGIMVLGARVEQTTLVTFCCIWSALAIYSWCGLCAFRKRQ